MDSSYPHNEAELAAGQTATSPRQGQPQLALIANEFSRLHELRCQARADMRKLNARIKELESRIVAKMRAKQIDELSIRGKLVVRPCEQFTLIVQPTKK